MSATNKNPDTPVLIAGGGPVGMTLALELARHGVASILVERNATTTRHPKMDLTNGRSMELFRRLGIIDELRAAGVSEDQPLNVTWATRANGHHLYTFHYPSPAQQRRLVREHNDGTATQEPPMRRAARGYRNRCRDSPREPSRPLGLRCTSLQETAGGSGHR